MTNIICFYSDRLYRQISSSLWSFTLKGQQLLFSHNCLNGMQYNMLTTNCYQSSDKWPHSTLMIYPSVKIKSGDMLAFQGGTKATYMSHMKDVSKQLKALASTFPWKDFRGILSINELLNSLLWWEQSVFVPFYCKKNRTEELKIYPGKALEYG